MAKSSFYFSVNIPIDLNAYQRKDLGVRIINKVIDRTRNEFKDKNNQKFKGKYSDKYSKSLDFKIAGKKANEIDLTLTGDMLDSLEILEHGPGYIDIGYKSSYNGLGKVEGNVTGLYGKHGKTSPRDFLGITKKDIDDLINEIDLGLPREITNREINKTVNKIIQNIGLENGEE